MGAILFLWGQKNQALCMSFSLSLSLTSLLIEKKNQLLLKLVPDSPRQTFSKNLDNVYLEDHNYSIL